MCRCYLELESGSVGLTSVCGQEEVPVGLLETEGEYQASGSSSSLTNLFFERFERLTSELHSLKLTTAEFLSTSSRSMGTSLCMGNLSLHFACSCLQHGAEDPSRGYNNVII